MSWLDDDAPTFATWRHFVDLEPAPFTVPGHKRQGHRVDPAVGRLLDADVPLFGGIDTVNLTGGVLAEAERRAAHLWGADWCRFSTGGSTHANQVTTLALGGEGDTVLVGRTAHRSVVSGLVLAGLRPVWLPPTIEPRYGIPTGVAVADLEAALEAHPQARGVLLVEPGYLGAVSDLPALTAAAHRHNVPVIVDQAWGAHFGFADGYPAHALAAGADALVMSAHKTLAAFTQGAIVLARTDRLDVARLDRAFETSNTTSPSGAILASIDVSRAVLGSTHGRELLAELLPRVERLRTLLRERGVAVPGPDDFPGAYDPAKVVLLLAPTGLSGIDVAAVMGADGVPAEMADRDTVVPIVTMFDTDASFARLEASLVRALDTLPGGPARPIQPLGSWGAASPQGCLPRTAYFGKHETVGFDAAIGRISAELVAPYPPGVPVLVPGEIVTVDAADRLRAAADAGLRIAYAADPTLATLQVLRDAPAT